MVSTAKTNRVATVALTLLGLALAITGLATSTPFSPPFILSALALVIVGLGGVAALRRQNRD